MKTSLITIGKTSFDFIKIGITEYENRIKYYANFQIITIPTNNKRKKRSDEEVKREEGRDLLKLVSPNCCLILLDVGGKLLSSENFAKFINQQQLSGKKALIFAIGGAYGFSKEVYDRADYKISLSPMTFSHQLIRVVFMEQLYRAHTILRGEPYHH